MHRAIYQALRDHDGDAAQAAMSEHLRHRRRLQGRDAGADGRPQSGAPSRARRLARTPAARARPE